MDTVKIKNNIFREYDIRGLYGSEIDESVSYTVGRSFGSYIKTKKVIIGRDNRSSSPIIRDNLVKGLLDSGCEVIDLGMVTTPMYYYAKKKNNIESGIMITASHNPKEYNGFKISFDLIGNAYGKYISDFKNYTNDGKFGEIKNGTLTYLDIKNDYLSLLKNSINIGNKKIKLVVDCGNGTGSIIIKEVLSMFDANVYYLNCESDPSFPNHEPDPAVRRNQIELSRVVKKLGYDYGFGVDGDADRVGIVAEKGSILEADIYLTLMYRSLANKINPKKAICDVKCSRVLIDELKKLGYKCEIYRTGNSYMNMKINSDNYMFGGEFSGHVWFRDKFPGFDDGIYAGLRVLEILSNSDSTLSGLLQGLNKYYKTEEIKVRVTEENKFEIVSKVKDYCDKKNYKYNDIDGVRVEFEDSWALVRASNTGPNLTCRFEAESKSRLESIQSEFMDLIEELK